MRSSARRWAITAAIVTCVALAWLLGWATGRMSAGGSAATQSLPVLGRAPSYHGLTNQVGREVSSGKFRGKVRVVTFLFPYCTTYCPLIAAHLVGFENLLKSAGLQNQVAIVAFDVDPAGTGPKQMRAFLKEYGWDPSNLHWQYLTGQPRTIRRIITGGYHIDYSRVSSSQQKAADNSRGPALTPQPTVVNPLAEKAHVDYDVTHNDALVIVDGQGRVRAIYDQADTVSNWQLLRTVKRLIRG